MLDLFFLSFLLSVFPSHLPLPLRVGFHVVVCLASCWLFISFVYAAVFFLNQSQRCLFEVSLFVRVNN